ncbi:MAG: hypothetical protein BMS9Abin36_0904 [Gammaproteobacteria bacterium]|nr:MAG: hypothetical protein BMS9Abin36_0904 [Gammaproteobacteria bacterium]
MANFISNTKARTTLSQKQYKKAWAFLDAIYATNTREEVFELLFTQGRRLIPYDTAVCFPLDPITGIPCRHGHITHDLPGAEKIAESYASYYFALDTLKDVAHPKNANRPLRNTDITTIKKIRNSEFYEDFLKPIGIEYVMGCAVYTRGKPILGVGLHRSRTTHEFSENDKEIFELLSPHIANAFLNCELRQELPNTLQDDGRRGRHLWEASTVATWIFDMNENLKSTNAEARGLFAELNPDVDSQYSITPIFPEAISRMLTAIKQQWNMLNQGTLSAEPIAKCMCIKIDERLYLFTATVMHNQSGNTNAPILLLTANPQPARARIVSKLDAYNFTTREGEITALVLQGFHNHEIGEQLCITEQTVKDHLRSIYSKAQVKSRAQLISKLLWSRQFH